MSDFRIPQGKHRLSAKGIAVYVALWALIFAVVRVLMEYSSLGAQGTYSIEAGMVTDFVLPIAIGLVLVALGVTIAYVVGQVRHAWAVTIWCFVIGCVSIPMLWATVMFLAALGIISTD